MQRPSNLTRREVQHCKIPAVLLSLLTLRWPEVVHDGVGPGRLLLPVLLHGRLYFNRKLRQIRTGRQLLRTGRQLGRPGRQQSGIGEQSEGVGVGRRQAARSHQEPVLGTGLPQGELGQVVGGKGGHLGGRQQLGGFSSPEFPDLGYSLHRALIPVRKPMA